nr:unnamed protein product [Haemonchus contortus]
MVVGLAQYETTSETDRSTADSILNENAENHQVTFEYNGQRAVLWIRPYITYVKLAKMLGGIFSIPDDYKITFIFEVEQTATAYVRINLNPFVGFQILKKAKRPKRKLDKVVYLGKA